MPFFESPRIFEINKGNFIEVRGSQDNYKYDRSHRIIGPGESSAFSRGQNHYNCRSSANDSTTSGSVSVIGHGSNAKIVLDRNAMNLSSSPIPSPVPLIRQTSGLSSSHSPSASPKGMVDASPRTPSPKLLTPDRVPFRPPTPSQRSSRPASPITPALTSTTAPKAAISSPSSAVAPEESASNPTAETNQQEEGKKNWGKKLKSAALGVLAFVVNLPKKAN